MPLKMLVKTQHLQHFKQNKEANQFFFFYYCWNPHFANIILTYSRKLVLFPSLMIQLRVHCVYLIHKTVLPKRCMGNCESICYFHIYFTFNTVISLYSICETRCICVSILPIILYLSMDNWHKPLLFQLKLHFF